jgi:pimeloyl-ACP methyl ester carboxylesterase
VPEVDVGGITLSYETSGDGDPVLLVCGTGQRSFTWQLFQVPALTGAGYRVVTFDNRGMPPSDAPPPPYSVKQMAEDTAGLIEQLDLAPCRVAGLSLGAFITQELALAHPDLVRAAVMMATIGRQDTFGGHVIRSWIETDEADSRPSRLVEAVQDAFLLFSPRTLRDGERMQQYIEFTQQTPPWENPGRLGQHTADRDYDDRLGALAGIRVPAMVMGFENDMLTGASLAREVADAIPECEYVEIPDCGHAGPLEKPDEVNRELLAFFAKH